jgi:hypothetical protein
MHVDRIPNRTSPPAFLLRETYREDGKVKKRTLPVVQKAVSPSYILFGTATLCSKPMSPL